MPLPSRQLLHALTVSTALAFTPALRPAVLQQPPPVPDVVEATIAGLQEALASGRTTSKALVEAYLARIEAYDRQGPELRAIVALNPEAAAAAEALDRERRDRGARGPLHGIPVVIKDNFETRELPTTGGSMALAGLQSAGDAFQVRKLREAGAIVLGKTNLHELAAGILTVSSLGGQTRNPYDPARNPGGSSGGTGAAVAASFAAFGMGSDTCGSIRIPASHNALVGLRGTSGLSSRSGIVPLSHTQDIGGPLARTVEDLAIALDATVGPDPADPSTDVGPIRPRGFRAALGTRDLKGVRVGLFLPLLGDQPEDQEVATVVRRGVEEMRSRGAETVEVTLAGFDELIRDSSAIPHEFKFDLLDYLEPTGARVRSLSDILEQGLYHAALEETFRTRDAPPARDTPEYRAALEKQAALRASLLELFDGQRLDLLAYPTIRRKAALVAEGVQRGTNCQLSAHSGWPAIAVPAGFTPDGMPVGIELLGRPWSDVELVALAYEYEQATHHRRPPFSTPALVDGQAPPPVTFEVHVPGDAGAVPLRFSYDRTRGTLSYEIQPSDLTALSGRLIAVHRKTADGPGPAVGWLSRGFDLPLGGGVELGHQGREALLRGDLYLTVTAPGTGPVAQVPVRMP